MSEQTLVYTMRDLSQRTTEVINEITAAGKPAFITRRGRFIARIIPLDPGEIESRVLAEMTREIQASP